MHNSDIVKAVNAWQSNNLFCPLICGNNSTHELLIPKIVDNIVVLVCLDCNFVDTIIPHSILDYYLEYAT